MGSFDKKKILKQHQFICTDLKYYKNEKEKNVKCFSCVLEKNLHTNGFIQTFK